MLCIFHFFQCLFVVHYYSFFFVDAAMIAEPLYAGSKHVVVEEASQVGPAEKSGKPPINCNHNLTTAHHSLTFFRFDLLSPAIYKLVWAGLMLASGTLTTLFAKIQFETEAVGSVSCNIYDDDNFICPFSKPWFSVLEMKVAMTTCLFLYHVLGVGKEPGVPDPSYATIKKVWFPAALDLLNTVLGNCGLVWINSSIYQMTRGSVVIFSALLSVKWLGRRLRNFHYWSIFFVTVAVVLVGLAGIQEGNEEPQDDECQDDDGGDDTTTVSSGQVLLGLVFILAAQLVTAVQFIAEDRMMSGANYMTPTALVGYEGLWGTAMFCVLGPLLTITPRSDSDLATLWHEDFLDSFTQLSNSPALCGSVAGYALAILLYNVSANTVTQTLSPVVRSILEACRTLGVWILGLCIYYFGGTCGAKAIGETWSDWSYLELGGFGLLLTGTFAYKALVRLPWVAPEDYEAAEEDAKAPDSTAEDKEKQYSALAGN